VQALYNIGAANIAHSNTTALSSGLVGYWTFDGGATHWNTGKVDDVSGHGNTGQLINMSTTTSPVPGKIGQAIQFNGPHLGQFIDLGTSNALTPSRFTITAWVYQNNQSCFNYIYSNARDTGGSYNGIDFKVYCYGQLAGTNWNGTAYSINASFALPAGKWNHVAFSYDGAFMRLYVDGAQAQTPVAQTVDPATPASFMTAIGSMGNGAGTYTLDGKLDDVRIYNRALSAQEVKQLYSMGR
jgi:Concanavalin A-like lectin/glucanases superfamily